VKQLHVAKHAVEAHVIRGFLTAQGIAVEVRGDHLTSGWGELPVDVCSVWVKNDKQYDSAQELLIAFLKGSFAPINGGEKWVCPDCREELEGQFTNCWNCGALHP
jgi:hypothetical protein